MGKDLNGKELGPGLSQRVDGRYLGRFSDRFGKRKCVYASTFKELKERIDEAKCIDKLHMNVVDDTIKLDDWFEKWMEIYKYDSIRESTKAQYLSLYKKHIGPFLGQFKLKDFKTLMVRARIVQMKKDGLGYEMCNKVKILLIDMFDRAIGDEIAVKNPARGVKLERDEEVEPRVLDPAEQSVFFETSRGTFYDNLFVTAVSTGLRPGELFALKETDLDFKRKEIDVNQTLSYQKFEGDKGKTFHLGPPKTKTSVRKVPMNKKCELALKKQIMLKKVIMGKPTSRPLKGFENLLFVTRYDTPLCSQNYIDAIASIVTEINLSRDTLEPFEPFSGHCFRHTFATRCFEAGIKPKTVQMYLGHATIQMTMDLYTHVLESHSVEEMGRLDERLEDIDSMEENVDQMFEDKIVAERKKLINGTDHFLKARIS